MPLPGGAFGMRIYRAGLFYRFRRKHLCCNPRGQMKRGLSGRPGIRGTGQAVPPVCKMDPFGVFQRAGQTASRRKTRRTAFRRHSRQGAPPFVCWILDGSPGTMYRDDSFMEQFVSWCFKNGHFSDRSGSHLPFLQESTEIIECLMVIRCN